MARSKPYTIRLAVVDVLLTFLTAGAWLVIVIVRELYRRN